jgi:hypothetical protein
MRTIFICGSIYLGYHTSFTIGVLAGITVERQRRREGTYTLVLLMVYGQGREDHEPAIGLLRDVMVCVVLNHSTRRKMIIWARREGRRGTLALPQFELMVRVEKIKLYPVILT